MTLNPADYIAYPKKNAHHIIPDLIFSKNTFDIDFLTMPLKLRPSLQQVPPQLNTNLNGAVYFGFRKDAYHLNSKITPLQQRQQQLNHFGFSVGGFTGIGNTFISPTTTNLQLQQEYDGVVWSKGFAAIIAINNFTVGIACGADHLLDKNRQVWIYQSKPWFGLAFGLNLN
ncbi:MAG: hypothetical protein SFU21_06605 [Flavihumibacter sp.]|nr:hypothetical protein [Flavihumibacter sp.]